MYDGKPFFAIVFAYQERINRNNCNDNYDGLDA